MGEASDNNTEKQTWPIKWLVRLKQAESFTDSSFYEGEEFVDNAKKALNLGYYMRDKALPIIKDNLQKIREELDDPDITEVQTLELFDAALFGMFYIPRRLLSSSATLKEIIYDALDNYPVKKDKKYIREIINSLDQEQIEFTQLIPVKRNLPDFVRPTTHFVITSYLLNKALTGGNEFYMKMKLEGSQKPVRCHYSMFQENPAIRKSSDPYFNWLMFESVASIMQAGNIVFTEDSLVRTVYQTDTPPSDTQREKTRKFMNYWGSVKVSLTQDNDPNPAPDDNYDDEDAYDLDPEEQEEIQEQEVRQEQEEQDQEADQDHKDDKATIKEYALDFAEIFIQSGGHTVRAYEMRAIPVFFRQALASGQIKEIDSSLLEIKAYEKNKKGGSQKLVRVRLSLPRLNARTYLIRRISAMMRMKNSGQDYNKKILLSSIVDAMTPGQKYAALSNQQKTRDRNFIFDCLDHFTREKWIKGYKLDKSRKNPGIYIELL